VTKKVVGVFVRFRAPLQLSLLFTYPATCNGASAALSCEALLPDVSRSLSFSSRVIQIPELAKVVDDDGGVDGQVT
jgi:hypothetical protein